MLNPVPNLPWPRDLFYQPAIVKTATTAPLYGKRDASSLCACGCRNRHSLAVSKVVTEEERHGPIRRVLWFASWHCKTTWEARNLRG